jgi:hypothetical protein
MEEPEDEVKLIHLKQYSTPQFIPGQIESKATGRIGYSFFFGNDGGDYETIDNTQSMNESRVPDDIKQNLRLLRRGIPLPNYGRYSTHDQMLELAAKDTFDLENAHYRHQFIPKFDNIFHESNYIEETDRRIFVKEKRSHLLSKLNNNIRDLMRAQDESNNNDDQEDNRNFKPFSRFDKKHREKRVIFKKEDMVYHPVHPKDEKRPRRLIRPQKIQELEEKPQDDENMDERHNWKELESPYKRKLGDMDDK